MSTAGGARIGTLLTTLAILATLAVLTGVTGLLPGRARAQDVSARVEIEFRSDGRCEVSSQGEGFRSHATYMPVAGAEPTELRCAMPPVPRGQTVALMVSLPIGMRRPGSAVPALDWVEVQGRWVGTARLTQWPDAVVVLGGRRWLAVRNLVTAATAAVILIVGMTLARYARRSRHIKSTG